MDRAVVGVNEVGLVRARDDVTPLWAEPLELDLSALHLVPVGPDGVAAEIYPQRHVL